MSENDYLFSIIDKKTRRVEFNRYLFSVTYTEAIIIAEDYLTNDSTIRNIFQAGKEIEIILRKYGTNISYQMKPNRPIFSNGKEIFKGWEYHISNKKIEERDRSKFGLAFYAALFFALVLFFGFLFTLWLTFLVENQSIRAQDEDIQNSVSLSIGLSLLIFLLGLVYNSIASIVRDDFNTAAKNKKDVIRHNLIIELPVFLAIASTLISFHGQGLDFVFPFGMLGLTIFVVFLSLFKVVMDITLDSEQLHKKKLRG